MNMNPSFLHPIKANCKLYFVQAAFSEDKSCNVGITDGMSCWKGFVDRLTLEKSSNETNMPLNEYCNLMNSALTGVERTQEFGYAVKEHGDDKLILEWKRIKDDVKYCLGSISMENIDNQPASLQDMLLNCSDSLLAMKSNCDATKEAYLKLEEKYMWTVKQLKQCTDLKQNLEAELLSKFVLVINEKKSKIRALQEQISNQKSPLTDKGNSSKDVEKEARVGSSIKQECPRQCTKSSFDIDDSHDGELLLPKRRRKQQSKPLVVTVSPMKVDDHQPPIPAFTSDFAPTTSSDSTVDINELLEDA